MPVSNYYFVTALPFLSDMAVETPMSLADLLEHVSPQPDAYAIVQTLLLSDDLMQRDSFLAGKLNSPTPAVLTEAQVRNESPLPEYLAGPFIAEPAETKPYKLTDAVWEAYFSYAARIAEKYSCGFLKHWVGFEVAMRNVLAAARASALGLDPKEYLTAADLADKEEKFDDLLSEWVSAADPLAGLKLLDHARWNWIQANEGYFSFSNDELAAYAAKLILVCRWNRLTKAATTERAAQ